jgi:Uma2 family endonuclease
VSALTKPTGQRLPLPEHRIKGDKIDTVVQPDICIICDKTKLDEQGCIGAPELIVEILSPGNSQKEMREKYNLYEETSVKEYWFVFPPNKYSNAICSTIKISISRSAPM